MRPKSIATVVSALRARVESVIPRSVERTVISLIVRIRVVLPAENGPVTTTLTACPPRRRLRGVAMTSESPHSGDQPQHQAAVDRRVSLDHGRLLRVESDGGGSDGVSG